MPFIEIEEVKINGQTKPFGGYIYDMNYSVGFNGTPSSLDVTLVNESGQYNFGKSNLSVKNTTNIIFGNKSLNMYPVKFDEENSSRGKFIKISYLDGSIILDQFAITQKFKHPDGESCFAIGDCYKSSNSSQLNTDNNKYYLITKVEKLTKFDPNGKILYSPSDFRKILNSKVSTKNSSVLGVSDFLIDYVGTFNDVLKKLAEDLGFSYYWSEDDQLVFIDAKSPISVNSSKINKISKKQSITNSYSIEDTYVNSINGYYAKGRGNVTAIIANNDGGSNTFQRKDTETLRLEKISYKISELAELMNGKYKVPSNLKDGKGLDPKNFIRAVVNGGVQYGMAYIWQQILFGSTSNRLSIIADVYGIESSEVNIGNSDENVWIKQIRDGLIENNYITDDYQVAGITGIKPSDLKILSDDFNSLLEFLGAAGRYYVRTVNTEYLQAYNWEQPFSILPADEKAKDTVLHYFSSSKDQTVEDLLADNGIQRIRRTKGDEFTVEPLSVVILDTADRWAIEPQNGGSNEDIKNVKNFYNNLSFVDYDFPNLDLVVNVPLTLIIYPKENFTFPEIEETQQKTYFDAKGSRFVPITNDDSDGEFFEWKRKGKTNNARERNCRNIKLLFKEFTSEQVENVGLENLYNGLLVRQDVDNSKPDQKVSFSLSSFPSENLKISDGLESINYSITNNGVEIGYSFGTSMQKLPSESYIEQSYFNIHPTKSWKDIRVRDNKHLKIRQ